MNKNNKQQTVAREEQSQCQMGASSSSQGRPSTIEISGRKFIDGSSQEKLQSKCVLPFNETSTSKEVEGTVRPKFNVPSEHDVHLLSHVHGAPLTGETLGKMGIKAGEKLFAAFPPTATTTATDITTKTRSGREVRRRATAAVAGGIFVEGNKANPPGKSPKTKGATPNAPAPDATQKKRAAGASGGAQQGKSKTQKKRRRRKDWQRGQCKKPKTTHPSYEEEDENNMDLQAVLLAEHGQDNNPHTGYVDPVKQNEIEMAQIRDQVKYERESEEREIHKQILNDAEEMNARNIAMLECPELRKKIIEIQKGIGVFDEDEYKAAFNLRRHRGHHSTPLFSDCDNNVEDSEYEYNDDSDSDNSKNEDDTKMKVDDNNSSCREGSDEEIAEGIHGRSSRVLIKVSDQECNKCGNKVGGDAYFSPDECGVFYCGHCGRKWNASLANKRIGHSKGGQDKVDESDSDDMASVSQ
jgi:hypothetical protein